ncbi:hypothetical protein DSM106972_046240 [Dulcicalothrix desertica PCC 7102]|uniref:Uncharacterized protein n=1 Tax=Dulcicalothrix desertica PCC 7102 TaxID=232991 RepID=A0A433VE59_9CYAN|nr:hypothetical protein [Dulcicalothrix desertica]RUT04396.1 hypothetical protein DSM106972_046240 [Dulcicalothrix desertica PCC 7102]TWH51250.1 CVNH domain-containing protein [Dulcicalothrix desertica PCC 7102]
MKTRVKNFIKLSGITLIAITPLLALSQETFAQSSSSSQDRCERGDYPIVPDALYIKCQKPDGGYYVGAIYLHGIINNNGTLVYVGRNQTTNFQYSCYNIIISKGDMLSANCRKINGDFNYTSIRIPDMKEQLDKLRRQ